MTERLPGIVRLIEHAADPGTTDEVQGLVGPAPAVTNVPATKYEGELVPDTGRRLSVEEPTFWRYRISVPELLQLYAAITS